MAGSGSRLRQNPDLAKQQGPDPGYSRIRIQAGRIRFQAIAGSGSRLWPDPVLGYGRIRFQAMAGSGSRLAGSGSRLARSGSRLWRDPGLGWQHPVLGWPDPVLGYGRIRIRHAGEKCSDLRLFSLPFILLLEGGRRPPGSYIPMSIYEYMGQHVRSRDFGFDIFEKGLNFEDLFRPSTLKTENFFTEKKFGPCLEAIELLN